MRSGIILYFVLAFANALAQRPTAAEYVRTLKSVTDIMVNDVTSPVAASRYYAYTCLSAHEYLSATNATYAISLFENLAAHRQPVVFSIEKNKATEAGALLCMLITAKSLMPSGFLLQPQIDSISLKLKNDAVYSIVAANAVADAIVRIARSDGFATLNNLQRYTPQKGEANWQPTPPSFMAPVEPHWNSVRTFFLDSAQQFKPLPPNPYNTADTSQFMKELKEVYVIGRAADSTQQNVAMFWDCNPFAVQQIGHVEFGLKKISPGGHWMGITGIACIQDRKSFAQTALIHAMMGTTLADAFIACWDEKYRSNRVRPETAIHALIDKKWKPLLQTPPFPEYVSGHSVASTAAAVILTDIFGSSFDFDDNTEVEFDLPIRHFTSFNQAAEEAAISRLYGGIHYRDAIVEGVRQGSLVGNFALGKLKGKLAWLKRSADEFAKKDL